MSPLDGSQFVHAARRIAVIGSGISGAGAAWLLGRRHEVTLFEAACRLGGHANTVDAALDEGSSVPVDTGFIVYNEANYPHFTALLEHLDVATCASDMSFSVSLGAGAYEYSGSGLGGLFGQRRNLVRPGHWRMLGEIVRFYARARRMAAQDGLAGMTLEQLLVRCGCSAWMRSRHILPMTAAIWSAPVERILGFPAESFLRFFENHGLFHLKGRPRWRTITGGSRSYVQALNADFRGTTRLGCPVRRILREAGGVRILLESGQSERFDAVVIATPADRALALLDRATPREQALLSAFGYERNRVVLHRDPRFMPRRRRCWASWNYLARAPEGDGTLHLTYWMNRLQPLKTREDLLVTLNPGSEPADRLFETTYRHPQYSAEALAAQRRLGEIQGAGGVWYCGAYHGDGFHEDGLAAAVAVALDFGIAPPWEGGTHSAVSQMESA